MALNSLGLGFLFTAKDLASGVMHDVKSHLNETGEAGQSLAKSLGSSFKQFGEGLAIMGTGIAGLAILGEKTEAADKFSHAIKLASNKVSEAEFPMASM